jgi:Uma2 family endonuclease
MSALPVEPVPSDDYSWDDLVRIWEQTDVPKSCRVEIIEGIITVAPPPANRHNATAERLTRQLYKAIPEDWGIYQTLGVSVPNREGLYIPDLVVVAESALERPGNYVPLSEAELVVEITSRRNANNDRVEKLKGYASAEVPLYLLLDPCHSGRPTATLYGEPRKGMYSVLETVKYGDPIQLPSPFDLTLDTSTFPVN